MTDLTPGDPSEKSEIYKMLVLGGLLGSEKFHLPAFNVMSLMVLRNHATFLAVQRFTYDVKGR